MSRPPRIQRLLAPNPGVYTLEGTNTWIVGEAPSLVIDPGPDHDGHLADVLRAAGRIAAVLVTHGHEDHAPGAPLLAEAAGAPLFAFHPDGGGERLRDGQGFDGGGATLTAVHTPGHSPDHVVFHDADHGSLFTGDAVLGRGTSVIDPPEGDLAAYLRSLRRMRDLAPRAIYPGHGPVVFDAVGKLDEYVAHRAEREQQVLAALADGLGTIDELIERIYAEYPPDVRPLAARSVLAHLAKLEAEGRAAPRGRGKATRYEAVVPHDCERCGRPVKGRGRLCDRCRLDLLQETPEPES